MNVALWAEIRRLAELAQLLADFSPRRRSGSRFPRFFRSEKVLRSS